MIKKLYSVIRRLHVTVKSYGFFSTIKFIGILLSKMMYTEDKNYNYVLLPPAERGHGHPLSDGPLVLTWFIPDFDVGSGGHTTIFRIANLLRQFGYTNHLVIIPPTKFLKKEKALDVVRGHFVHDFIGEFFFWGDELPASDAYVATSWETAYYVNSVEGTGSRFYFVQDFEPSFFPMSSQYVFAENTYRLGLKCLAASPWLAALMRENYEATAASFELAYSPEQYYPMNIPRSPKTVVFYARHLTVRRGFELGVLALQLVKQAEPDVEIVLFGATAYPELPFPCRCCGVLSHEELRKLYNAATVGFVISLTNYSLIPNEMMACKLPIVDIDTECMSTIYRNGEDIILAPPEPHGIASALLNLLRDDDKRQEIVLNAYGRVKDLTWMKVAEQVDGLFRRL